MNHPISYHDGTAWFKCDCGIETPLKTAIVRTDIVKRVDGDQYRAMCKCATCGKHGVVDCAYGAFKHIREYYEGNHD